MNNRNGPDGKRFVWGPITEVHSIGSYDIVEAKWENGLDKGVTHFFVYVNKKDAHIGAATLDGALALAIAHKYDGSNSQAALFFMRMIRAVDKYL